MKVPIKIAFIGEAHVGKTSMVRRLVHNHFSDVTSSTIGAAFCTLKYPKPETPRTRLYHIWDTAGQERYGALIPLYLSGSAIIVIVYDITSKPTFDRVVTHWVPFIRQNLRLHEDDPMPMLYLIGNKNDIDKIREVPMSIASEFAAKHEMGFCEVSAKTGNGTEVIMENISRHSEDLILKQARAVESDRVQLSVQLSVQDNSGITGTVRRWCGYF